MSRAKIKAKNLLTVVIAILIIGVALFYYFNNKPKDDGGDKSGGANQIIASTQGVVSGRLSLHFIDVGQGDCIFIEFPDGNNMLIDSGNTKKANADKIISYISQRGYERIDLLLATHSDADHIGNFPAIFEAFEIGYCFRPFVYSSYNGERIFSDQFNQRAQAENAFDCSTKTYYNFLNSILNEGCEWQFFDKESDFEKQFEYNGEKYSYKFDFLSPTAQIPYVAYSYANEYSPICLLTYGEFEILLTGDATIEIEEEVIYYDEHRDMFDKIDVLKVGHHGSNSSTGNLLLETFAPDYAVILCGTDNSYKHPHQVVMNRLYNSSVLPYRSDLHGDIKIVVETDGEFDFITQHEVDASFLYVGQDA